ncbi:hypothetical protein NE237_002632 [Protea cynaroides]|uniref:Uncharacterized protein n=1 Tax=Protea cynaroides TaxID=273540 RepID=A0A9Q0KWG0_9MAGN|nr:hypothetical protein NE237_002632 [Protea cynaroides]
MMVIPQAMLSVQEKGIVTKGVGSHQGDPVDGGKGSSHVRVTCRGDDHRGSPNAVQIWSVEDLRDSGNSVSQGKCGIGHRSGSVRLQTALVLCRAGSREDGPVCIEAFPMELMHVISHVRPFQVAAERFLTFGGAGLPALTSAPDGDIFPRSGRPDVAMVEHLMHTISTHVVIAGGLRLEDLNVWVRQNGVRVVAGLKFEKAAGVFIGHVEDGFASVSGTPGEVGPPVRQNTWTALDQAVSVDGVHTVIGATRVLL